MSNIAFLGTGAMGTRMATKLLEAGHDVTVWNRTTARAEALADAGATIAGSPRAAATSADVVFSMVRDDDASRRVWLDQKEGALAALGKDALAIECSTLSVPYVRELAEKFKAAERGFLDAPLAGSRPQAEAGQLIFFVGGEAEVLDRVQSVLAAMAGAVHHAGDHAAGATVKLMVNALFGAQLGAIAELIGFAEKAGIDTETAIDIIGSTPVCSPAAKLAAGAMLASAWTPAFPIDLVAKDFGMLSKSADCVSACLPICAETGSVYAKAVEEGFGDDNITGIVQLYGKAAA